MSEINQIPEEEPDDQDIQDAGQEAEERRAQKEAERAQKRQEKKNNPNSIKNRAKTAAKEGFKQLWHKIPIKYRIIIVASVIVLLVLAACILYVLLSEKDGDINVPKDNLTSILPKNSDLGKEYKTTGSFINYKLKMEFDISKDESDIVTIDNMYDMFMNQKNPKEYLDTINDMKGKYSDGADNIVETGDSDFDKEACIEGTIICIDTNRGAVSPNEDRELYKHILMTEKYNFNAIRWHSFSGKHSTGGIVDEEYLDASDSNQIKVDESTGLQYPSDSSMSETDFSRGFLKYLQNMSIPEAMYDGTLKSDGANNGMFAYQILSNAMSNVEVNKYKVDNREQVMETIELSRAEVSKEFCIPDTDDCHTVYRTISLSTKRGPTEKSDVVKSLYQYRLSSAETFDLNIYNFYLYTPYNENDEPMKTYTNPYDYSEPYSEDGWTGTAYGKRYETHNFWWDKLNLVNTRTECLDKNFVKSYAGGGFSDNAEKYYSQYEENKSENKVSKIDRILLINSKQDIFTRYMDKNDALDKKNIGYTRMFLDDSYMLLRQKFLNYANYYVYGQSLEIDKTLPLDNTIDIGGSIPVDIPEGGLGWPVQTSRTITQLYGYTDAYFDSTQSHTGIDIANTGTKTLSNGLRGADTIVATHSGTVTYVKNNETREEMAQSSYGNYVKIEMDSGQFTTLYGHLAYVAVNVGDHVEANQPIGIMGTTGSSYGVHLHYEVRLASGSTIDPLLFYNTTPEYGSYPDREKTPSKYYSYESSKSGVTNQ